MKRTALYTRASVAYAPQTGEQVCRLNQKAGDCGWSVVLTLNDGGPRGPKSRRPGLDALIRAIEGGDVDIIAVSSITLLGRSLPELVSVLSKAAERGVGIVALDERIDTTIMPSMSMTDMLGTLSGYQRFQRQEAVLIGQQAARNAGVRFGRPPVPEARLLKAREALAAGKGIRPSARIAGISAGKAVEVWRKMQADGQPQLA